MDKELLINQRLQAISRKYYRVPDPEGTSFIYGINYLANIHVLWINGVYTQYAQTIINELAKVAVFRERRYKESNGMETMHFEHFQVHDFDKLDSVFSFIDLLIE